MKSADKSVQDSNDSNKNSVINDEIQSRTIEPHEEHPIRNLVLFQLKLAVDALRDILLSPISLIATIMDLIEGRRGSKSYFSMLLKMGRESERRINLFQQHREKKRSKTIDSMIRQVEDILVNEYKTGGVSEKAKAALEKTLRMRNKDTEKNTTTDKN
ncbi:MAG: hypothetical protein OQJ89_07560 [Kangiellaceae bacterium]|nr:hypothetical protein [Kangiellaceae bacterium]